MAYTIWGKGSEQYPSVLGSTADSLHFHRPRVSTNSSDSILGLAITSGTTFVPGALETVHYMAVASDRLFNIESTSNPIASVQTDLPVFQPLQFSSAPAQMSTPREAGFVYLEKVGATYTFHYQAATYVPWNVEWKYDTSTGGTLAPDPITLNGSAVSLASGISSINRVLTANHVSDDTVSGLRDFMLAWESDNGNGTYDVTARVFNQLGAATHAQFTLLDNVASDRAWTIGQIDGTANFLLMREGASGAIIAEQVTPTGGVSSLFQFGSGASNVELITWRPQTNGNYAVFSTFNDVGSQGVKLNYVDATGTVLSTFTDTTSLADPEDIHLNIQNINSTLMAVGYQTSATAWKVSIFERTNLTQVDSFTGTGVLDRVVTSSNNNVGRVGVFTRSGAEEQAINSIDFTVYDPSSSGINFVGTTGSDVRLGTPFADTMTGGDNADKLAGGDGNDSIDGGTGRDMLDGWNGADTLIGGTGNDVLDGGAGADSMVGGDDNDIYYVDNAGDIVNESGTGYDEVIAYLNAFSLAGTGATEELRFEGNGNFNGTGNSLNNLIIARLGNDTLSGGDGNDELRGDSGDDQLTGGNGNDTLDGADGNDTLIGGAGADSLNGGNNTAAGDTASYTSSSIGIVVDLLTNANFGGDAAGDSLTGIENVIGSGQVDILLGGVDANVLEGGDGADFIFGRFGADTIRGGDDGDTLFGDDASGFPDGTPGILYGADSIYGEGGNDNIYGEGGADFIDGGDGIDTANYSTSTHGISVFLQSGQGFGPTGSYAAGDTFANIENVVGTAFNDQIFGNAAANTLEGAGGSDTMAGSLGSDIMVGGSGADYFIFSSVSEGGPGGDIITDFTDNVDVLDLRTLFTAHGLSTTNPVGSGVLIVRDLGPGSPHTEVAIDLDGSAGGGPAFNIATLLNITPGFLTVGTDILVA